MKIMKNQPYPKRKTRDWAELARQLDIGDSFLCSPDTVPSARQCLRRDGVRSRQQKQKDGQVQVWRIQ